MAKPPTTLTLPRDWLALQGFLVIARWVAEEADKPEWERSLDVEDLSRMMQSMVALARVDA